jgi:hypothetical protein
MFKALQNKNSLNLMLALLLVIALLLPSVAMAASASIQVSATVRPWLKVSAMPKVASYQVDASALQRGYVDLPASLAVEVATNVRNEVLLDLVSGGVETVQVLDGGAMSGVLRIAAATSCAPVIKQYGMRILLPSGIGVGTYPLNVQVSAAAL